MTRIRRQTQFLKHDPAGATAGCRKKHRACRGLDLCCTKCFESAGRDTWPGCARMNQRDDRISGHKWPQGSCGPWQWRGTAEERARCYQSDVPVEDKARKKNAEGVYEVRIGHSGLSEQREWSPGAKLPSVRRRDGQAWFCGECTPSGRAGGEINCGKNREETRDEMR